MNNINKVRQYIRKILLTEAAKDISLLPKDTHVNIISIDGQIEVGLLTCTNINGKRVCSGDLGRITAMKPERCSGAWEIVGAMAKENWGPFLYDIMMEYVGEAGLTCDRNVVSKEAASVWDFYLTNRPDVKAVQLDYDGDPFLTYWDKSDDCGGLSFERRAKYLLRDAEPATGGRFDPENEKHQQIYLDHWATKKYIKTTGTKIIDELKSRRLIQIETEEGYQ